MCLCLSSDSTQLFSGFESGFIFIYDTANESLTTKVKLFSHPSIRQFVNRFVVLSIFSDPSSNSLVVSGLENRIVICSLLVFWLFIYST